MSEALKRMFRSLPATATPNDVIVVTPVMLALSDAAAPISVVAELATSAPQAEVAHQEG